MRWAAYVGSSLASKAMGVLANLCFSRSKSSSGVVRLVRFGFLREPLRVPIWGMQWNLKRYNTPSPHERSALLQCAQQIYNSIVFLVGLLQPFPVLMCCVCCTPIGLCVEAQRGRHYFKQVSFLGWKPLRGHSQQRTTRCDSGLAYTTMLGTHDVLART